MPGWPGFSSQPARLILTAPRKAVATIEVMTGGLMNGTRNALVLFVLLLVTVAAFIGASHHATIGGESADRVAVAETTALTGSAASPIDRASLGEVTITGETSTGAALVLGCALLVLCCAALLRRRLRVTREAGIGAVVPRGPTLALPVAAAPLAAPSLRLLSISRT